MSIKGLVGRAVFTTRLFSASLTTGRLVSSISSGVTLTLSSHFTMQTTVVFAILVSSFCLLECSNVPPAKPSVEVVEVQEVLQPLPVKPVVVEEVVKPAKPAVVLDVNLVKDRIHQSWPLLCLVPKAYLLKPSLKLACPKFAVEATSKVVKKLAAQSPVRVNVLVTKPSSLPHPVPVPVLKH